MNCDNKVEIEVTPKSIAAEKVTYEFKRDNLPLKLIGIIKQTRLTAAKMLNWQSQFQHGLKNCQNKSNQDFREQFAKSGDEPSSK